MIGGYWAITGSPPDHPTKMHHLAASHYHVGEYFANHRQAACSIENIFYVNGRISEKLTYWNNLPSERTLFEYFDDQSLYSVQTQVYQGDKISIMRKDLFESAKGGILPDRRIETAYYNFDKDKANTIRQVDTYWPNTTLVKERRVFDPTGILKAVANFEYDVNADNHDLDDNETIPTVTGMTLMNADGEIVSKYHEKDEVDVQQLYHELGFSEDEIGRRNHIAKDVNRIPILIMDGGIDISHPELAYKLWRNPGEIPNGKDDDGNGLADDIYGISDNPRLSQPVYDLRLPRFGLPSFSHGTLVASIATRNREDAAIMSVSEMTIVQSNDIMPKIERLINSHGVRFTNMSFIYDKQMLEHGPQALRPVQIMEMIENTPHTLHVVAAGNGNPISGKGYNIDKHRQAGDLVPAMLPNDNTLVVGALDTDQLNLIDYPAYKVASFSNVGEISVDILAPGTRMCGAQMGGGIICDNGTSFAAPYVLNHGVLEVAKANPDLTIFELKEIIMKSAYIPDLDAPLPVRSGGILHTKRAVDVAKWLIRHPNASIDTAVLAVRKADMHPIAGEDNSETYLNALQSFWTQRQLEPDPKLYALSADE